MPREWWLLERERGSMVEMIGEVGCEVVVLFRNRG